MILLTPGPVRVITENREFEGELLGYIRDEHTDILAIVRLADRLLLEALHPARVTR